jgi:hypothetical protein
MKGGIMKTHKLMVKTHMVTGLKYLCYTTCEGDDYLNYKGSGTNWKKHLKKYGDNIKTELIFESHDYEEFKKIAIKRSTEFNVVDSDKWANIRPETGTGGDTVSNRFWINNGIKDKYHFKDKPLPEGWERGRINCVFNDSEKQKQFSSRANLEKRGNSIKKAWTEGKFDKRDNSKCGKKGDDNPSKRPEVKQKIREYALSQSEIRSERMKKNKVWEYSGGRNKIKKEK